MRIRAPGGQEVETSAVASSGFMWRVRLLGEVEVRLAIRGREMPWVRAKAVCMLGSDRVLLSEGLLEQLKVLPFGTRWLILGEVEPREEAAPQY